MTVRVKTGGGFEVDDEGSFAELMDGFSNDAARLQDVSQKAGTFVMGQAGATESVMSSLGL